MQFKVCTPPDKKTKDSHLQTATSSKTRKGCLALCLSAVSAPCLCLVSSLWILLLAHAPDQTTEHVQRASVAQCHSKIAFFSGASTEISSPRAFSDNCTTVFSSSSTEINPNIFFAGNVCEREGGYWTLSDDLSKPHWRPPPKHCYTLLRENALTNANFKFVDGFSTQRLRGKMYFLEWFPGLYLKFSDKTLKTNCQILYSNTLFFCDARLCKWCMFSEWIFDCNVFGKKCFAWGITHGLNLRFSDVTFKNNLQHRFKTIIEWMDFSRSFGQNNF